MRSGRVGFQPIARAFRRGRVPQARILAQLGEEFIEHFQSGSYLKQNYEMLAERARGLLSGEVSRPDEHETVGTQSTAYTETIEPSGEF